MIIGNNLPPVNSSSRFSYGKLSPSLIANGTYQGLEFPAPLNKGMKFDNYQSLIEYLSTKILEQHYKTGKRIKIGISGGTNAGKSTLTKRIMENLEAKGKHVVHFSEDFALQSWGTIDAWKAKNDVQFTDPWKYWLRWEKIETFFKLFDNLQTSEIMLDGLFNKEDEGKLTLIKTAVVKADSILLFDGVFIFDQEHYPDFDLSIFLCVKFREAIQRSIRKGKSKESVILNYEKSFIPSQLAYREKIHPEQKADLVIDLNDFESPQILIYRG